MYGVYVEGRRPRTWLESVEADIAELEIDKEDVHDRKKWRRNVMKRKSNHIGKTDYKPILLRQRGAIKNTMYLTECSV